MENKRFEDWETVECSECARYWDSSCDGVTGSKKPCNSYLATRNILIPEKLKALEKRIKWLSAEVLALEIILMVHLLVTLVGGYHG